jgi:hypothetical protein
VISTPQQSHPPQRCDASVALSYDDVCRRQLREAERELGAYFTAVAELFGAEAAAHAAECWIELLETTNLPAFDGRLNWREITILAASRLAIEEQTSWCPVMQRTDNEAPTGKGHHNDQCRA